jgi:hypothetical protein
VNVQQYNLLLSFLCFPFFTSMFPSMSLNWAG